MAFNLGLVEDPNSPLQSARWCGILCRSIRPASHQFCFESSRAGLKPAPTGSVSPTWNLWPRTTVT